MILLRVLQWFRYIIGQKISTKCANVLPALRNFFCFQTIFLCQFDFSQFLQVQETSICYSSGFSGLWFLNQVVCKLNRQKILHQKKMNVQFRTANLGLGLLLTEKRLRIRDLLRNFSIFWPIILFTDSLPVCHRRDISNCRELSFNPLDEFPSFLPHTNSCYCICSLKKMCNFW